MRIYDSGKYRDATAEEAKKINDMNNQFPTEPTQEERLEAVEAALIEMIGGMSNV